MCQHETVNHSMEFIDSTTGAHTQSIELLEIKLKCMRGYHASELPSYLDEFMWRERFGTTAAAAYRSIMVDIAAFNPV